MKVWYLPLEPYRERYTEQLLDWTTRAYARLGVEAVVVHGQTLAGRERILTGPVLDAQGRAHYALTQVAALVARLGEVRRGDWIFVEDLFTPGYEALPYVFDQLGDDQRPNIATRNYAQSVDPDDFTFPMRGWMRRYEELVDRTASVVFVASTVHKEMLHAAGLDGATTVVAGLPFDPAAVRAQGPEPRPWATRPRKVVYASRLDREKQPHFFMDVALRLPSDVDVVVCTGSDLPRSNDPTVLERLAAMADAGRLRVRTGLTKADYYAELATARVQLNTARQDFVSFTALEASAYGVPTLAPAFRSFPEALENRASQLYVPWSVDDAASRLLALLDRGEPLCGRLAVTHGQTFDRMVTLMKAVG